MKQSLPAERLHGKPYINLTQPPVGLLDGQMSLLFQIKGGEVGWGEETIIIILTSAVTVLIKRHLEFYIYGITIYHQYV